MGEYKEDWSTPVAGSSRNAQNHIVINCAAATSSTHLSEVQARNVNVPNPNNTPNINEVKPNTFQNTFGLPEDIVDSCGLLNKTSRCRILYLNLVALDQSIDDKQYNSSIDKVITQINRRFTRRRSELIKQNNGLQGRRKNIRMKVKSILQDVSGAGRSITSADEAQSAASNFALIEKLDNEKDYLIQKLNSMRRKISSQPDLSISTSKDLRAIVAANKSIPGGEDIALLTRLINRCKQEKRYSNTHKAVGHVAAHKAREGLHKLLSDLISILKAQVERNKCFIPNYKLCDLLLGKYPPRFSRDKVTLTAADAAEIARVTTKNTIKVDGIFVELKPIPENTTLVVPSDGGSQSEDQRNFTRCLNTAIEFDLGLARKSAANGHFFLAKIDLAAASILIAKPEGLKELLDQVIGESEFTNDTDGTEPSKEVADEIIVRKVIRDLHIQLEGAESTGTEETSLVPEDRRVLVPTAQRYSKYFEIEGISELARGRHYSKAGNLLVAGAKCILGNDLAEKATLFKAALNLKGGPHLPVLSYLVKKNKSLVPAIYDLEKAKPPKPAAAQQLTRPPIPYSGALTSSPGTGSVTQSVRELTDRILATVDAITDEQTVNLYVDDLRALGLSLKKARKLFYQKLHRARHTTEVPAPRVLKELPTGFPGPIKPQEPGPSKPAQQGSGSWNRLQSADTISEDNMDASSNNTIKPLTGSNQPLQQPGRNQAWSQWRGNPPAQYTAGTNNQGLYPPRLPPAGVPKSFLQKQQQELDLRIESGQTPSNSNNAPIWPTQSGFQLPTFTSTFIEAQSNPDANAPMFVQTNQPTVSTSRDSPTEDHGSLQDMFALVEDDELDDGSKSPTSGQKRMSAFQRLGPVAAAKKPKLTINLLFSKDDAVREVVDEQAARETKAAQHVPVYRRADVLASGDHTVVKYLACWPWRHRVHAKRTAGPRASKSSMIMEEEQMVEGYESNRNYVKVAISNYPPHYTKEDVLDLVLETVDGKSFIPCFVEFTREECIFLVLRCEKALLALHKKGLYLHDSGYDMPVHISLTDLTLSNIGFIPRIVLGKRLTSAYDGEAKLNLEGFCLESDVSHFVYFPLNRPTNQTELVQLQSGVSWEYLRELNLANNRLESLEGFSLGRLCPRLRSLDVSRNRLARAASLLPCRGAPLLALRLEGNPLCRDCTEPAFYTRLARLLFPSLAELDGVKIQQNGELPTIKQNYCPPDAKGIVEKFLEVYFPLLDSPPEERMPIEELYHERATLSITYCHTLRFKAIFRRFRDLFTRCRLLEEENLDLVEGAAAIARHVSRWPALQHDPPSFVVDVLHHDESSLVLRVAGALKVTSQSLAEDEHQLWFARTLVLHASDGCRYRLRHEMLHWAELTGELAGRAFQLTAVKTQKLSLKMESAPDDDLKEKLVAILMKVTNLNRKLSERCLELRNWDLKTALEYFMKLLKLNSVDTLDVTGEA